MPIKPVFHNMPYNCIVRNIGVELNLMIGKIKRMSPNFIPKIAYSTWIISD